MICALARPTFPRIVQMKRAAGEDGGWLPKLKPRNFRWEWTHIGDLSQSVTEVGKWGTLRLFFISYTQC